MAQGTAAGRAPAAVVIRPGKRDDPPRGDQIARLLELRARRVIPIEFAFQMSMGWPPKTQADAQVLITTLEGQPEQDTATMVRLKRKMKAFLDKNPDVTDFPPAKTRRLLVQAWDLLADLEEALK